MVSMARAVACMVLGLFVATGVPATSAFAQKSFEDIANAAKADCAAEWVGDFAMQEFCYKRQTQAYNKMLPVSKTEADENLKAALVKCLDEWTTANGQDWAMVEFCYRRQEAAYKRLKGG